MKVIRLILVCNFLLGSVSIAQLDLYKFETNFNPESDLILYYSQEKRNNFMTIHTSVYEINTNENRISHKKGNNLKRKKPWINANYILKQEEIESIIKFPTLQKLPQRHEKIYKRIWNRPLNTFYLKTPSQNIFIQWEGTKFPNKSIVQKLIKIEGYLKDVVNLKMQSNRIQH